MKEHPDRGASDEKDGPAPNSSIFLLEPLSVVVASERLTIPKILRGTRSVLELYFVTHINKLMGQTEHVSEGFIKKQKSRHQRRELPS